MTLCEFLLKVTITFDVHKGMSHVTPVPQVKGGAVVDVVGVVAGAQ